MKERSVAATSVEVNLPAEALREWRAMHKNDTEPDALGNKRYKKLLASAAMRRMGADLCDGDTIQVAPDGSLVGGDDE